MQKRLSPIWLPLCLYCLVACASASAKSINYNSLYSLDMMTDAFWENDNVAVVKVLDVQETFAGGKPMGREVTYQVMQTISGTLPNASTTVSANDIVLSNSQRFSAGFYLVDHTSPGLTRGQRLVIYVAKTGSPLFANPATSELVDALTAIGALHQAGNPPALLAKGVGANNARIAVYCLQELLRASVRPEDVPGQGRLVRSLRNERGDESRILHEQALEQRLDTDLHETDEMRNSPHFWQLLTQSAMLDGEEDSGIHKLILASRLLNKLSGQADGGDHYLWAKTAILHPQPLDFSLAYPLAEELLFFADRRQETANFFLGLLKNDALPPDTYRVADAALRDPQMFRTHQPGEALSLKIFAAYVAALQSPNPAVRDGASTQLYSFCAYIVHWPQAFTLTRRARHALQKALAVEENTAIRQSMQSDLGEMSDYRNFAQ